MCIVMTYFYLWEIDVYHLQGEQVKSSVGLFGNLPWVFWWWAKCFVRMADWTKTVREEDKAVLVNLLDWGLMCVHAFPYCIVFYLCSEEVSFISRITEFFLNIFCLVSVCLRTLMENISVCHRHSESVLQLQSQRYILMKVLECFCVYRSFLWILLYHWPMLKHTTLFVPWLH